MDIYKPIFTPHIANSTSEFCWQDACLKREEHVRVWRQPSDTTASFKFTQGLYAAVDTVHLMKVTSDMSGVAKIKMVFNFFLINSCTG